MQHELPRLPFALDALEPHMSRETLEYHHGKHHKAYVDKLNTLIKGTVHETQTLEQIMLSASGSIFNNAAQAWNHDFFWKCLAPAGKTSPADTVLRILERDLGGLEAFKKNFSELAAGLFGSGWAWLVRDKDGKLALVGTSNAENPLRQGLTPLFTCDVWEHAYYIDYRNARAKFLENAWNVVNWDFIATNLSSAASKAA